jgi:hypothetical protein
MAVHGQMGRWMVLWWVFGVVILVLLVWTAMAMIRSAIGSTPHRDVSPE